MSEAKLLVTKDTYKVVLENKSYLVTRTEEWTKGEVKWKVFSYNEFANIKKYQDVYDKELIHKVVRVVQINLGVF